MESVSALPAQEPPIASTSAIRLDDEVTSATSAPISSSSAAFTPFAPPAAGDDLSLLLSSELQPLENATLTIRCIKSFEYRTEKNLVLKGLNLRELTVEELLQRCREGESHVSCNNARSSELWAICPSCSGLAIMDRVQ